ncbi:flagellar biosynthesis protein FlhF [Kineothrix sedimenti]|uniref:Flagellar biosynthesis protein FlhF n=1 Tax=Kineothrix sedimenti TaxID=3123317 RepID=A0ABZ3F3Q7_9FIRM
MIIKKFQGKTENEAVEAAKRELGKNIVIMNVKGVKKKGFFRFFRSDMVEVTIALEEENERYYPLRKEEKKESASPSKVVYPSPYNEIQNSRSLFVENLDEEKRESTLLEEKLDNLHILLEQQLQRPESEKVEEEEAVHSELEKFTKILYNTMLDNEVSEKNANQIIDEIEKNVKPNMPFDYALSSIYQKMVLKFGKPASITPPENGVKVIFFVGPTGVGKTTTIAKIASKFIVDDKKKVALLTADTYRIAAAEQLRTYANILEVPFRVIYAPEEIAQVLENFADYDYVFVDTSGHSYQNEEQKANTNELIHSADGLAEKEVFLVLSATTKYRDLIRIVDSYSQVTDYKLIFTKLDETSAMGNLLNIKLYTGASLSYVTCGQNVPDDIEEFNPQKTVKKLLGGQN